MEEPSCYYRQKTVKRKRVEACRSPLELATLRLFNKTFSELESTISETVSSLSERILKDVRLFLLKQDLSVVILKLLPTVVVFLPPGGDDGLFVGSLLMLNELSEDEEMKFRFLTLSSSESDQFPKILNSVLGFLSDGNATTFNQVCTLNGKSKRSSETYVIIIRCIESFSLSVLEPLILMLREFVRKTSRTTKLVFTTSLMKSSFYQHLSQPSVSSLKLECVHAPSAIDILDRIAERICFPNFHDEKMIMSFGAETLELIFRMYLCHQFSVTSMVKGFKLALLHHFRGNPQALLYDADGNFEVLKEELENEAVFTAVSEIPLFENAKRPKHILKIARAERQAWFEARANLLLVHKALGIILPCLPYKTWGTTPYDFYLELVKGKSVLDHPSWSRLIKSINILDQCEVLSMLDRLMVIFEHFPKEEESVRIFIDNFNNLEEGQADLDAERAEKLAQADQVSKEKKKAKKETIESLRQQLIQAQETRKELNYFEQQKTKLAEFLSDWIYSVVTAYETSPLRSAYVCNPVGSIRPILACHSTENIERWLTRAENRAKYPLARAFQVYEEHGRQIPLSIMFDSFLAADESKKSKKEARQKEQQAEFLLAINELVWMGYLKPGGKGGEVVVKADV